MTLDLSFAKVNAYVPSELADFSSTASLEQALETSYQHIAFSAFWGRRSGSTPPFQQVMELTSARSFASGSTSQRLRMLQRMVARANLRNEHEARANRERNSGVSLPPFVSSWHLQLECLVVVAQVQVLYRDETRTGTTACCVGI